jgi:glycosyltransferase involved in cell wall biosynthesis
MKILHVNEHSLIKGGAEAYLFDTIKHLEKRGHTCYLAHAKDEPNIDISSIILPSIGQASATNLEKEIKSLKGFVEKNNPDIIHIHSIWNIEFIKECLNLKPCLMTSHDYRWLCPDSKFYWKYPQCSCDRTPGWACAASSLKNKCLTLRPNLMVRHIQRINKFKQLSPKIRAIITASQYVANRYKKASYPVSKTHVIPYYCSFAPLKRPRPLPKQKCISIIGRTADYKGIDYFLSALGNLPNDVSGCVMGDFGAKKEKDILQKAISANCDKRIKLESWSDRNGVSRLLNKTSILIFPSIWPEPFGIIGLEAMSFGVPVIGSEIGGIPDWLKNGITGYLCKPKSAEEIASFANKILNDPSLMSSMGRAGQESIRKKYLPELHMKKLEHVYASCLKD